MLLPHHAQHASLRSLFGHQRRLLGLRLLGLRRPACSDSSAITPLRLAFSSPVAPRPAAPAIVTEVSSSFTSARLHVPSCCSGRPLGAGPLQ
eukprot:2179630-Prymnesium_polylepis.1